MLLAMLVAAAVSFASTPMVKALACKVGAIDVPKDNRRMHKVPIPRMGGLAIFLAFLLSVLVFADIDRQMQGILLGSIMIVILGVLDDIMALKALPKLFVQIAAAGVAVWHGCTIQFVSNPNVFSEATYLNLGWLSIPVTIIWIVAITNAVNFIDGLDGLAVGVSAISTASLIVVALMVKEVNIAVILCALFGACLGFIPYNMNPAKIFMGDTGSTFLGYILATLSITGLFKMYAIISFAVPFLILGIPIFDISFAFLRRIAHGQNPMKADRGHFHHRRTVRQQAVKTHDLLAAGPCAGHLRPCAAHGGQKGVHRALAAVRHRNGADLRLRLQPQYLLRRDAADVLRGQRSFEGIRYQHIFCHGLRSFPKKRAAADAAAHGFAAYSV